MKGKLGSPTPLPFYVPFLTETGTVSIYFSSKNGDIGLNTLMTPRSFESIPRCSCSYLPFIVANINTYASMRNMRLNEKKCKDVINFWKCQPTVITLIQLNGIVIDRVSSYKLLGVIISDELSWNEHFDSNQ